MNAQHTPGPWMLWDDGRTVGIADPDGEPLAVAEVVDYGDMTHPKQLAADHALIGAAPDMLAALALAEAFIAGFEDDEMQDDVPALLLALRAAIAKAKGAA